MYIAPSSGEPLPNLNLPFKSIERRFEVVSGVWNENAALFERLMKIHSNSPILLYYGLNNYSSDSKRGQHTQIAAVHALSIMYIVHVQLGGQISSEFQSDHTGL